VEPGGGPAQAVTTPDLLATPEVRAEVRAEVRTEVRTEVSASVRSWVRLAAVAVLLVGLVFVQDPGFLVPDTKLDLVVDPAGFLGRALHLWDGVGAFGQLQNQAYGYLWPMGPFFWVLHAVDVPGWAVQRAWESLVVVVAFLGVARVSRALGIRSDVACVLAGVAYALSPRMLTTLGPISIEAWPSAVAPWVLLALVRGSTTGSARRAAALAGLATAMVGGVNAAATSAVLPLGVVWVLTRAPGPRRRTLVVWWPLFTLLATVWWLVPLFAMGAYSPPFLDFIESARVTTFPTTLFDALRGTSDWVPYIDAASRAGNDLVTRFYLPLNSGVVLLLGLAGLAGARTPHRRFLVWSVALGLLLVTMGHLGSVQGWFAPQLHGWLDEALAPLRNVHKFDPVVRLPLVVGLAASVDSLHRTAVDGRPSLAGWLPQLQRSALLGLTGVVVLGAAAPAFAGRITPAGGFLDVPGYWQQTADFLARSSGRGTSLLVPGSSFGEYVWGSPQDEPMQSLARSPWAVRNAIPLAPPGGVRMLDEIERRLAQGDGSVGLTAYAARAGIRYLVVRNDLQRSGDVPDPVLVHQALAASPGLSRVATFGPTVGGLGHLDRPTGRVVINGGWQATYPAVEVFAVPSSTGDAATPAAVGAGRVPLVVGGPEDLDDLEDLGLLGAGPAQLASDASVQEAPRGPLVLTDGYRSRERSFGRVHDATSAVRSPADPRTVENRARDFLLADPDRWSTTARVDGVRSLTASSSASDADNPGGTQPGDQPFAALDGSAATSWVSGAGRRDRAWWQVDLDSPFEPGADDVVTMTGGPGASEQQAVRVLTAGGSTARVALGPGETRRVRVPAGRTGWVRVEDASGVPGARLDVGEVAVPGVRARRTLVLPPVPARWGTPAAVVLRASTDARTGCARVGGDVRCAPGQARTSEEPHDFAREVRLAADASYDVRLRVAPRPGAALEAALLRGQLGRAEASSTAFDDPRAAASAAIDGDGGTTWIAAPRDQRPSLTLGWVGRRTVSGLTVRLDPDAAARRPERLRLEWPGGRRTVRLGSDGSVRFRPVRTSTLTLTTLDAERASSLNFDRTGTDLPVGVSEVRVRGAGAIPVTLSPVARRFPCGSGPTLTVDGRSYASAVTASPRDLQNGGLVDARVCGPTTVRLRAGATDIDVTGSAAFDARQLVLSAPRRAGALPGAVPEAASVRGWDDGSRLLTPPAGSTVLALRQNVNAGWVADQSGRRLEPVVLDGWQQGYAVRGTGTVSTRFAPDRTYRLGLGVGLVLLLALGGLCCLRGRRWPGRDQPPLAERRRGPVVTGAGAVLVGGLLAGWPGVLVALVGLVAAVAVLRLTVDGGRSARPWLVGSPVLVAALGYVLEPWGSSAGWAGDQRWEHYLVLVSLTAAALLSASRGRDQTPRSRIAGRSTQR
jgi:arabinofuranan 3-O-arabinosyltransferase